MSQFISHLRALAVSLAMILLAVSSAGAIDRPDGKTPETVLQS